MHPDRFRFVFFLTLLFCFLFTVASVLFFAFGYRFNFDRGIFVYTGSITIKTNPKDVSIFLDGTPVSSGMVNIINQSHHISGIAPGEHFLRIEAEGFRPWERKVTTQSGISTEFWNIILPRESYLSERIASGTFQKFFPSPDNKFLALTGTRDGEMSISILDITSGNLESVLTTKDFAFDFKSENNVEWTEDNTMLLVPTISNDGHQETFIVNRETGDSFKASELSEMKNLRNSRWNPDNDGSFFTLSGSSLFLVPTEKRNEATPIPIADEVLGYDLSDTSVFFLQKNGAISRVPLGKTPYPEKKPLASAIESAIPMSDPVLTVYDEKRLTIRDRSDGSAILWNDTGSFDPTTYRLGKGIRHLQFSDDGKKLLFSTENEISTLFVRDWDVQPSRKIGEITQIARLSSPILWTQWARDYEHILFIFHDGIAVSELDHRDKRQIETLISSNDGSFIQALSIGTENRIISLRKSADLPEITEIVSIDFPENENLFAQ